VRNPKTPWSHLFLTMEAAKSLFAEDIISDYSVSETTLEQVRLQDLNLVVGRAISGVNFVNIL